MKKRRFALEAIDRFFFCENDPRPPIVLFLCVSITYHPTFARSSLYISFIHSLFCMYVDISALSLLHRRLRARQTRDRPGASHTFLSLPKHIVLIYLLSSDFFLWT